MSHFRAARAGSALVALMFLAACGGSDNAGGDAQAPAGETAPAATDAAPPAAAAPGAQAAATPDQEFLRQFVDHHEGMIQMARQAQQKGSAAIKENARMQEEKQSAEQKEMLAMLSQDGITHQPALLPSNKAMADSMAAMTPGANFDMMYHMHTIAHHREGVQMIDQFLPRLTRPEVRQMAERMKADQQKDIQEHEGKMQH